MYIRSRSGSRAAIAENLPKRLGASRTMTGTHPNILLIISDEHSPHALGYEGNPIVRTPNLDRLAKAGAYFEAAYCQSPLCAPSRMSMLTGKHPHRCSAWHNRSILYPEHVTLPAHFARHGYTTAIVGKLHIRSVERYAGFQFRPYGDLRPSGTGHQREPVHLFPTRGRDQRAATRNTLRSAGVTMIPTGMLQESVVNAEAAAFVRDRADRGSMPWLLVASYTRPHPPLTSPRRFFEHYWPDNVDMPDLSRVDFENPHPYDAALRESFGFADVSPAEVRRGRAAYYASCSFVDEAVGDLLAVLGRDRLLDDAIIVYLSDHGEMCGEHGLWWKSTYYDGASRVPLLILDPNLPESHGRRVSLPVELDDLFPTLCVRAGIPVPGELDGRDMTDLLRGNTGGWRGTAIMEYWLKHRCGPMRMLRTPEFKYVHFYNAKPVLFDLTDEAGEFRNRAGDPGYREEERELQDRLMGGFDNDAVGRRSAEDLGVSRRARYKRGTPNQYSMSDGRLIDAERSLYALDQAFLGVFARLWRSLR